MTGLNLLMLRLTFMLTILGCGVTPAQSQSSPPSAVPTSPPESVPLDGSVGDVNPLSTSLRHIPRDMRVPSGFSQVLTVPGHPELLMRVDGGIYAVFPRSEYTPGRRGPIPVIPANTVFYIGAPPAPPPKAAPPAAMTAASRQSGPASNRPAADTNFHQIDAQIDNEVESTLAGRRLNTHANLPRDRVRTQAAESSAVAENLEEADAPLMYEHPGPVTIATDAAYRINRLQLLLQRAARAEMKAAAEHSAKIAE